MKKLLCAAVLAPLLLATPIFASAGSHLSTNPAVVHARVMVGNGAYEAALKLLRTLGQARADDVEVLFLTGLAAMGLAEDREEGAERDALLDEAISALRTILVDRPELVRVRLELARAFYLKGRDRLAREEFERVLAGGPAPPVVANVSLFLREIRKRKRWTSYFGASLTEDSNLGSTSDSEFIYIFGLPFRRDAESRRIKSGTGVVAWGGVEYQHPLAERWKLRAGTDLVRHEFAHSDFDRTHAAAHLGPRWLVTEDTEMSLLAQAGQSWTAGKPQNHTLGGSFEVRRRFFRRLRTRGEVSWQHRDFDSSEHLDGPLLGLVGSATWYPSATMRVGGGLGYNRSRPTSIPWRNATRWGRLGVSVALPRGFVVGGGAEARFTRFDGRWGLFTPGGVPREDRTRIFRATLYNRLFTLYGFSPQLAAVHEQRGSNAQLYDYRRNRFELRFQRQF